MGHGESLALFVAAMRVRAAIQRTLFRDAMESLAGLAPTLRRWDLNGSQTYGLAALATAWERRAFIPGLPPARHRVGASTDTDFLDDIREGELSREADAFYFLLDRPYPAAGDDHAHRRLRAWALLRAVDLAISASPADGNLSRVCKTLSQAADESADRTWRDFLLPLGAPAERFEEINWRFALARDEQATRWPELLRDLLPAGDGTGTRSSRGRTAKHSFLDAARRLARGEPRPLEQYTPAGEPIQALISTGFAGPASGGQLFPLRDELFARDGELPVSVGADRQSDGTRSDVIEVDPFDTAAEQDTYVRSVRFQLGAAARFLPWAWHQVHPPEAEELHRLVSSTLALPIDRAHQLLAAITSLALTAGMGLEQAALLPISTDLSIDGDWCLDLDRGRLLRRPPRHDRPINLTDAQRRVVAPTAQALAIPLPRAVLEALLAAQRVTPDARQVSNLWTDTQRSLRSAFLGWLKTDRNLARLQPSMLAHLAGQTTFVATNDHVLARLVSSNRIDALPASTVYAAFSANQLAHAYERLETIPASSEPLNAAGSRLDVLSEEGLQPGFADLLSSVLKAHRGTDWAHFHNRVVLLWDAALRAASGARPVAKLWPSAASFDWELAAVYVDDKESPVSHNGRLIPLPRQLCADFKRLYVDAHLPWVIARLGTQHSRSKSDPPGLLFTVREEEGGYTLRALDNEFRRSQGGGVEPLLPLNYLRHRLRTELHRQDKPNLEIVDAVLGHGDGGSTRTHGDFSMRCWIQDAEAIRPALARLFDDVGFALPPLWEETRPLEVARPLPSWLLARETQSRDKAAHERTAALKTIRTFLADEARAGQVQAGGAAPANESDARHTLSESDALLSGLSSLSEEQLDRLGRSLKSSDQGMPSSTGDLRFQTLLDLAGDAWDRLGQRVRLRRHYSSRQVEPSPYTTGSSGAVGRRAQLLEALDRRFGAIRERSRLTLAETLGLAALDLALVSRIGSADLIRDVVLSDDRWRVVRLDDNFFIEWSPSDDLTSKPDAPVQRFTVSRRCAWLLNVRIRGKGRRRSAWAGTGIARVLTEANCPLETPDRAEDPEQALRVITAIVDQANVIELPGSVAAYLSQRLQAASLPWGDWIRLHFSRWHSVRDTAQPDETLGSDGGRRQRLDKLPEDEEEDFELTVQTCYVRAPELSTPAARRTNDKAASGHELVAEVRDLITGITHREDARVHRGDVADQIALAVKDSAGDVSSTIQLLCLWAIDLLLRPGRSRKLATRSVLRYFGALSPRFTAMGYEVELDRLEDEHIEAFYRDVLDGAKVQDLSDIHDALRNFHKFAIACAGVADIDWASIAVTDRIELGSPGFIDEATYLQLLDRLPAVAQARGLVAWQLQCFAILGYRFGLRGGEIEGLRRNDLIYPGAPMRVIVRNNPIRSLKTRSGRRVVPQLFALTSVERDAIDRLRDSCMVDSIGLENPPLFSSPTDSALPVDGPRLRAAINSELKALTGQPHSSMHKLRKSFGISLWIPLEAPHLRLNGLQRIDGGTRTALRARLLGTPNVEITRRSSFAVAVALGHAHPQTALRSYLPVLADVTASLIPVDKVREHLRLELADVGLMALERSLPEHVPAPAGQVDAQQHASGLDMLRALLFLSQGRSPSATALRLDLPFEAVEGLAQDAHVVFEKLVKGDEARLRQHTEGPRSRRLAPRGLLSLIHVRAYARLRAGLGSVTPRKPSTLSGLDEVSSDHLVGMVGGRRQISMWQENHFRLAAFVARLLVKDRSRLRLEVPKNPSMSQALPRLTQMATDAGWIPPADATPPPGDSHGPLCTDLVPAQALPRVELVEAGITIHRRVALRLSPGTGRRGDDEGGSGDGDVADSLEFVVAVVCANALARWHHRRLEATRRASGGSDRVAESSKRFTSGH